MLASVRARRSFSPAGSCSRKKRIDLVDFVPFGDLPQNAAQIGFGVQAIELRGAHDGVDGSGSFSVGIGTSEQVILPAYGNAAHSVLGDVVRFPALRR